ncbi:hypothetical protein SAMN04489844_1206 [Nocardioides exalbidus]|uniref:Glycosyl transferases group 1 n=1 Tax=Nocardioides exalbidus TaxID=402596 RepID=A0A1H4MSC1_9ACTN|nr:hypothetical protein [Nocardioides exalbidus]SEB85936.1 hypothetical protein SAMN04489844_1206 [Nocardioides exalbidus]
MTAPDHGHPRRSLGGRVVDDALDRVGFSPSPDVQIVETARPRFMGGSTVLVQSAWNFLPDEDFAELARPYPARMQRRMRQRRLLAALNVRRSSRVVALTAAMADLVTRRTGREVEVSEVLHPMDVLDPADGVAGDVAGVPAEPFVLVPGTITWYKDPLTALALTASRSDLPTRVVLAGNDDGSGCWQEVRRVGDLLGLDVTGEPVSRPVMVALLRRASAVLLTSRLESLGFSMTEALALSPGDVVASAIPAHTDLAARAGRTPSWLGQEPAASRLPVLPRPDDLRASWVALGRTLGLPRTEDVL